MSRVHARRAVTALLVIVLASAYVTARAEGLRPGHVCPMSASHETGEHDLPGPHGGHHDAPADEPGGHECQCAGNGCCPPNVVSLPSVGVRTVSLAPAPATRVSPCLATLGPDLLLRGVAAARAPPILL